MKNIYSLLLAMLITTLSLAQAPQTMSYQAVIRDASGSLVTEQEIGMKISILQGTSDGIEVYTETQTPATNKNGLVSIEIGGEAGFAEIDWSDGPYFLKTETDPEGGTNYTITGVSQLLSVPYALYAKTAETITGEIADWLKDPPTLSTVDASSITGISAISGGNITDDGGATIIVRGVVWDQSENPTVDEKEGSTSDGIGSGEFTSKITELTPGETYFIRAYAVNSAGAAYGNQVQFTTLDPPITEEQIKLQKYLEEKGYSGIEPTTSGLYYVVLEEGEGASPERYDFVNIEFTASLIDGTVFETSNYELAVSNGIDREDKLYGPAKLLLENLIQGLREGIMLMKEGGMSRIIIPSNLAFGSTDYDIIPPYSTLIYDVELLDVISDPVQHEQDLLNQYLEDNDITVSPTESGLYYIETEAGTGDLPDGNATVTLHYKGYLLDGRLFDESTSGNPLILGMSATNIIPGFIEGVKKMRKDGKALFIIPWDIGYGADGSSEGMIPPYSTLVFEVEVINIQ